MWYANTNNVTYTPSEEEELDEATEFFKKGGVVYPVPNGFDVATTVTLSATKYTFTWPDKKLTYGFDGYKGKVTTRDPHIKITPNMKTELVKLVGAELKAYIENETPKKTQNQRSALFDDDSDDDQAFDAPSATPPATESDDDSASAPAAPNSTQSGKAPKNLSTQRVNPVTRKPKKKSTGKIRAYNMYFKERSKALTSDPRILNLPKKEQQPMKMKIAGAEWKKLSSQEQKKYKKLADSRNAAASASPQSETVSEAPAQAAAAAPQLPTPQNPPPTPQELLAAAQNDPRFWVFVEQMSPDMGIANKNQLVDSLAYAWTQMEEDEKMSFFPPEPSVDDPSERAINAEPAPSVPASAAQRIPQSAAAQDESGFLNFVRQSSSAMGTVDMEEALGLLREAWNQMDVGEKMLYMQTNQEPRSAKRNSSQALQDPPSTGERGTTKRLKEIFSGAVSSVAETASSWLSSFATKDVSSDIHDRLGGKLKVKVKISPAQVETLQHLFERDGIDATCSYDKKARSWYIEANDLLERRKALVQLQQFGNLDDIVVLEE